MELGATTAEQREGSSTPQAAPSVPCLVSLCLVSLWGWTQQRLRGARVGGREGRASWEGESMGGGRNVNPSLGVSVWQVFMPLCCEHLHYALNTWLPSQAEKNLYSGCIVKENASAEATSGNRKNWLVYRLLVHLRGEGKVAFILFIN